MDEKKTFFFRKRKKLLLSSKKLMNKVKHSQEKMVKGKSFFCSSREFVEREQIDVKSCFRKKL